MAEHIKIECPCCNTPITVTITSHAQTTVDDSWHQRDYPKDSGRRGSQSPDARDERNDRNDRIRVREPDRTHAINLHPEPKWLDPARDRELQYATYCVCRTGAHDLHREDSYPCVRCSDLVCAHVKCRHDHELNECDNRETNRKLKLPSGRSYAYSYARSRYEK